jgi:hypothetical protein
MPSDVHSATVVELVRKALAPAQHTFCAAVENALARGEAWWNEQAATDVDRATRVSAELGAFAADRVDPRHFAALLARPRAMTPEVRKEMKRALDALREACAAADVTNVSIDADDSLAAVIDDALAEAGRAFAAARVIEHVRADHKSTKPAPAVVHLPFQSWARAERRSAPPLVVTVAGADLHAGALGEYADGRQKIVLIVEGACPPAALVRLVTPGTFVMQTSDVAALDRMVQFDGPAIAAIVPESAASFTHDPAAGAEQWQRLSIERLPSPPFAPVPGMSAWQLREDVRQLEALAAAPAGRAIPPGAPAPADAPDAVDQLASWLLGQADLTGLP